jgi:hypothetical protein
MVSYALFLPGVLLVIGPGISCWTIFFFPHDSIEEQ